MNVIPAIDLKNGECVRLLKGDFEKVTTYSNDPAAIGRLFGELSVSHLHLVDLDGARTGAQHNAAIVKAIVHETHLHVQLGGGIRNRADVAQWLDVGVGRCVVGSAAIDNPDEVRRWIAEFGADRIVLALDVLTRGTDVPVLMTHGWEDDSGRNLWETLAEFCADGICNVLCTDIDRDGALSGPNTALYASILQRFPTLALQASGGIRHATDLEELRTAGLPAAISGRALLDGTITKEELVQFQRNA